MIRLDDRRHSTWSLVVAKKRTATIHQRWFPILPPRDSSLASGTKQVEEIAASTDKRITSSFFERFIDGGCRRCLFLPVCCFFRRAKVPRSTLEAALPPLSLQTAQGAPTKPDQFSMFDAET